MDDEEKLERAFNHIRNNRSVQKQFLDAANNNEWELAGQIVMDVLHMLGYAISAFFNLVGAVADWFSSL